MLLFSEATGRQTDLNLRGSDADIKKRYQIEPALDQPAAKKGRGRPKLGVVGREVTLLPRHWAWLDTQRGGASAHLRRMIDVERKASEPTSLADQAQDRTQRLMSAVAGDLPGYEEALRGLYAKDELKFKAESASWPVGLRELIYELAAQAWSHPKEV